MAQVPGSLSCIGRLDGVSASWVHPGAAIVAIVAIWKVKSADEISSSVSPLSLSFFLSSKWISSFKIACLSLSD